MSRKRDTKPVPVYCLFQFTWNSPCYLGTPCNACRRYAKERPQDIRPYYYYRRSPKYVCERATPAKPAFHVNFPQAIAMIHAGLGRIIHDGNALELTFSVVTNLRDTSSKADEHLVLAYLRGSKSARIAVHKAWSSPPPWIEKFTAPSPSYPFV